MDQIAEVADKWADKFAETVGKYGPDVAQLALEVGRIGAAKEIAVGIGCAVFTGALAIASKRLFLKAKDWFDESDYSGKEAFPFIGGVVCSIGALVGLFITLDKLTNLYAWAGIWRPEVYLAAKALGL